jgi:CRP-like cAMP-binding protein
MNCIRHFFQRFFSVAPLQQEVSDALAALCTRVTFQPNEIIFEQGDAVTAFFWMQHGDVELRHGGTTLKILQHNALMGEDAVFDHASAYDYAAVAITDTALIRVDAVGFMALVQQYPTIGLQLLKAVSMQTLDANPSSETSVEDDDSTFTRPLDFIPQGFIANWSLTVSQAVKASTKATQSLQFFSFLSE